MILEEGEDEEEKQQEVQIFPAEVDPQISSCSFSWNNTEVGGAQTGGG